MQIIKKIIIFIVLVVGVSLGYYFFQKQSNDPLQIVNFNFDQDVQAVDQLFRKGDNFYWMIAGNSEYSVEFMLKHATSSQNEKRHDLILKSAKIDGKLIGFLAYHPKSVHVWRLLFLIVDQDFRKQGIAKKLLHFAVKDMIARGALKITLFTRNNNFKAQALYKNFGFKVIDSDTIGVWLSWNKG